jgi:hypothetical protein
MAQLIVQFLNLCYWHLVCPAIFNCFLLHVCVLTYRFHFSVGWVRIFVFLSEKVGSRHNNIIGCTRYIHDCLVQTSKNSTSHLIKTSFEWIATFIMCRSPVAIFYHYFSSKYVLWLLFLSKCRKPSLLLSLSARLLLLCRNSHNLGMLL